MLKLYIYGRKVGHKIRKAENENIVLLIVTFEEKM